MPFLKIVFYKCIQKKKKKIRIIRLNNHMLLGYSFSNDRYLLLKFCKYFMGRSARKCC